MPRKSRKKEADMQTEHEQNGQHETRALLHEGNGHETNGHHANGYAGNGHHDNGEGPRHTERHRPRLANPFPREARYLNDGTSMTLYKPMGSREHYQIAFDGKPAQETTHALKEDIKAFNADNGLSHAYEPRFNEGKWSIKQASGSVTLKMSQDRALDDTFAALAEMEAQHRGGFDTRRKEQQTQIG